MSGLICDNIKVYSILKEINSSYTPIVSVLIFPQKNQLHRPLAVQ